MKEKRRISLTAYIISLIIIAIIIGVTVFVIVKENNNREVGVTQISQSDSNGDVIDTNDVTLQNTQTGESAETDITSQANGKQFSEKGEELSVDNELLTKIREEFDFNEMTIIQKIYENAGSTIDTFSNEFKLLVAWNNLAVDIDFDDERVKDLGKEDCKVTIEKEDLEESMKEIFGSNVKYIDESFDNTDDEPFSQFNPTKTGMVTYSNGSYTANFIEGGGMGYPFIDEYVVNGIKYSDRVEIFVKTAFVRYEGQVGYDDFIIYKDYEDGEMKNKIDTISVSNGEDFVVSEDIKNNLNTFKYTFNLDNTTGEYYFAGFDIVK